MSDNIPEWEKFLLNLLDTNTYMEVTLRTGDKVSLLGRMSTRLMEKGLTVEENLEEGQKILDFLRSLIEAFEADLTEEKIREADKDR